MLASEHAASCARDQEKVLAAQRTAFDKEEARIGELDKLIGERKSRIKSEEAALKALPGGELYVELKEQTKRLAKESARLKEIGTTVDSALRNRVQKARQWLAEVGKAPLAEPVETGEMQEAIKKLEGCAKEQTEGALADVTTEAEQLKAALSRAVRPTNQRLGEIRDQKGRFTLVIATALFRQARNFVAFITSLLYSAPIFLFHVLGESLRGLILTCPRTHPASS